MTLRELPVGVRKRQDSAEITFRSFQPNRILSRLPRVRPLSRVELFDSPRSRS